MHYSSTYTLNISLVTFILHSLSNNKTTVVVVVYRVGDFMHIYLFQMSVYVSKSKRHEFRLTSFRLQLKNISYIAVMCCLEGWWCNVCLVQFANDVQNFSLFFCDCLCFLCNFNLESIVKNNCISRGIVNNTIVSENVCIVLNSNACFCLHKYSILL